MQDCFKWCKWKSPKVGLCSMSTRSILESELAHGLAPGDNCIFYRTNHCNFGLANKIWPWLLQKIQCCYVLSSWCSLPNSYAHQHESKTYIYIWHHINVAFPTDLSSSISSFLARHSVMWPFQYSRCESLWDMCLAWSHSVDDSVDKHQALYANGLDDHLSDSQCWEIACF